jgi:Domain of unknown function (DUF4274)
VLWFVRPGISAEGKWRMSNFKFYEKEQRAMISWLQGRSPDVWHIVAEYLNWDFAQNVLEWIVSQPQCDLATAALLFWKGAPEYWLKFSNSDAVPRHHLDDFNFAKNLADRANSGLYARQELAFAGDARNMIGGVDYFLKFHVEELRRCFQEEIAGSFPWEFPTLLTPPIPGRAPIVSPEENPKTGTELQNLLADLGTKIGGDQVESRPQKYQIGERVTKIWYPVNNIYPGFGTILNVNDSNYKFLYLVQLDNGMDVVLTDNRMEKIS